MDQPVTTYDIDMAIKDNFYSYEPKGDWEINFLMSPIENLKSLFKRKFTEQEIKDYISTTFLQKKGSIQDSICGAISTSSYSDRYRFRIVTINNIIYSHKTPITELIDCIQCDSAEELKQLILNNFLNYITRVGL